MTAPKTCATGTRKNAALHTAYGRSMTAREWFTQPECVVPLTTLYQRVSRNWGMEKALSTPFGAKPPKAAKTNCNIGPLSRGGPGRFNMPRLQLDTPSRVTNSSQRALYVPPKWEPVMSFNRRV